MKRILIDFLPFQCNDGVSGASSFAKAVYDRLFMHDGEIEIYGAYDATIPVGKYDYRQYAAEHQVELLDISTLPLSTHIRQKGIDVFFIAIGQLYAPYNLAGIDCKTIMFIHDIFDYERLDNQIDLIIPDNALTWCKRLINLRSGRWKKQALKTYQNIMPLYTAPNTQAYTVSEYSRNALQYYFPEIRKEIHICYSPLRTADMGKAIENSSLKRLVTSGKRYLFLLAANRRYKNASLLFKVFKRLHQEHPDLYLLTLKYGKSIHPNHVDIPFLSDSDVEHAYHNAHALVFASLFEGFGYPPIEALKHGTPTVASNVTSIPEILGDAGIYFSPLYAADMYRAINTVLDNRDVRAQQIQRRYQQITQRQEEHLSALVNLLTQ